MPSNYLLHVNSRPRPEAGVDDSLWEKWYTEEHVPDLVNSKTSTRAAMYRETHDFAFAGKDKHPRKYLVLYQSDFEQPLKSDEYVNGVRHGSDMWPRHKQNSENGEFDARNYKLIQEYDPKGVGDSAPPFLCTVEMDPVDETDFDKWYREEHLDMLGRLPGYRRSLRYVIGPPTPLTLGEPPKYLAIHEVDGPHAFEGPEAEAANTTPWTVRQIQESKVFVARMWERMYAQGFD